MNQKRKLSIRTFLSVFLAMLLAGSLIVPANAQSLIETYNAGSAAGYDAVEAAQKGGQNLSGETNLKNIGGITTQKDLDAYIEKNYKACHGTTVDGNFVKVASKGKLTASTKKDENAYLEMCSGSQWDNYVAGKTHYDGNSAADFSGASAIYKGKQKYYKLVPHKKNDGTTYNTVSSQQYYIKGTINSVTLSSGKKFPDRLKHAIAWRKNDPGLYVVGIDSVSITWKFYSDAACTKEFKMSGYFLNKDIDAQQGVSYGSNVKTVLYADAATKVGNDNWCTNKVPYLRKGKLDGDLYIYAPGAANTDYNKESNSLTTGVVALFEEKSQITTCWTFAKVDVADQTKTAGIDNGGNGMMSLYGNTGWTNTLKTNTGTTGKESCEKSIYTNSMAAFQQELNANYNSEGSVGQHKFLEGISASKSYQVPQYNPSTGSNEFVYIIKGHIQADNLKTTISNSDLIKKNQNMSGNTAANVAGNTTLTANTRFNLYDTIPDYLTMTGEAQAYVWKGNDATLRCQTNQKVTVRYDTHNAKSYNGAGSGKWTQSGAGTPTLSGPNRSRAISAKYGGNDTDTNGSDYKTSSFSKGMDVYLCIPVRYCSEQELAQEGKTMPDVDYVAGAAGTGFQQDNVANFSWAYDQNTYTIKEETTVNNGQAKTTYKLTGVTQKQSSEDNTTNTVSTYAPYTASLNIHKVDENGKPLAGAVFRAYEFNEQTGQYSAVAGDMVTDANGNTSKAVAASPTNPAGWFRWVEVSVPSGYQFDPEKDGGEVHFIQGNNQTYWRYMKFDGEGNINGGTPVGETQTPPCTTDSAGFHWTIKNRPKTFNIVVTKRAAENINKTLNGFTFKLGNGCSKKENEITLTPQKNGSYKAENVSVKAFGADTPQANWTVYEAETSDTRKKDTIACKESDDPNFWAKNFAIDLNGADGQTVTFDYVTTGNGPVNKAKRSTVKMEKTDPATGKGVAGATYAVVANEDITIKDYAEGPDNAIMDYAVTAPCDLYGTDGVKIHSKGDAITAKGTVIAKGTVVGYITTGKNGKGTLADVTVTYDNGRSEKVAPLYGGKYYIQEVDPAEGYFLSDKKYTFETADNKEETISVDVENNAIQPEIAVSKLADKTLVAMTNGETSEVVTGDKALDLETGEYNGTKLVRTYKTSDKVLYTVNVTNTGNVPLTDVDVKDEIDETFNNNIVEGSNRFVLNEDGAYTTTNGKGAVVTFKSSKTDEEKKDNKKDEEKETNEAAENAMIMAQANADGKENAKDANSEAEKKDGNDSKKDDKDAQTEAGWLKENDIYTGTLAEELKLKKHTLSLTGGDALIKAFEGAEFNEYAIHPDDTEKKYLIAKSKVKDGKLEYYTSPEYGAYVFTCDDEIDGYDSTDLYLMLTSGEEENKATLDWESENIKEKNIVWNKDSVSLPNVSADKSKAKKYVSANDASAVVIDRLEVGDSIQLQYEVTLKDKAEKDQDSLYNRVKAVGQYVDNYKAKLVQDKGRDHIKLIDPGVAVSKLASRTTGATWNPETGRYDGKKKPGQYTAGETVDFRIDATNTGKTILYNTKVTDTPSAELLAYMENGMKFDFARSAQYTYDKKGNAITPDAEAIVLTRNNTKVSLAEGKTKDSASEKTEQKAESVQSNDDLSFKDPAPQKEKVEESGETKTDKTEEYQADTTSPLTVKYGETVLERGKDYSLKTTHETKETVVGEEQKDTKDDNVLKEEYTIYTVKGKNNYAGGVTVFVNSKNEITDVFTTNTEVKETQTEDTADTVKMDTKNTTVHVEDNEVTVRCNGKKLADMEDYTVKSKIKREGNKVTATYTIKGMGQYSGGVEASVTNDVVESVVDFDTFVDIPAPETPQAVETGTLTTKLGYTAKVSLTDNYTVVIDKLRAGDSVALCLTGVTKTDVSNTNLLENKVDISSTYLQDNEYVPINGEPDTDQIYMINPGVTPAKEADRTTGVTFNAETGRFDGERKSGTYAAGETITWSLYATNTGDCELQNVKLTDTMSEKLRSVLEKDSGAYNFNSGDTLTTANGQPVVATINEDGSVIFDKLQPKDYVKVEYSAVVKQDIKKLNALDNKVEVTAQYLLNGNPTDITGTPDEDEVNVIVPGVAVAKIADKTTGAKYNSKTGLYTGTKETGTYKIGETVDFTITVTNTLSTKLYNVTVTDKMDKDLASVLKDAGFVKKKEIKTAAGHIAKVTYDGNKAVIKTLEPGDHVDLHYKGTAKKYLSGKLNNNVHVNAQYKVNNELVDIDGNDDSDCIKLKKPNHAPGTPGNPDSAKTGDYFKFGALLLLFLASAGSIAGVVIYRRRRNHF